MPRKPLDPKPIKRSGIQRIQEAGISITSADASNVRLARSRRMNAKVLRSILVGAERYLERKRPASTADREALEWLRSLRSQYPELTPTPDD